MTKTRVPLRVYLSSTRTDLIAEYRPAARQAVQNLGFVFVGMENYPAENRPSVERCLEDVRSCDLYVGVFAHRYGACPPGESLSFTELEYREAVRCGCPQLIFVLDASHPWSPMMVDKDRRRIDLLRAELCEARLSSMFTTPDSLGAAVERALRNAADELGRVGRSAVDAPVTGDIRRAYLRWLVDRHQRLELRGVHHTGGGTVSVRLEQIYLALQADPSNPLERAAARQALFAELQSALDNSEFAPDEVEHAAWFFVSGSPVMPSLESRDRFVALDRDQKELLNLAEAYYRESQLVVLGDPGSGKTTLARWLALVSAKAMLNGQERLEVPLSQVDPAVEASDKLAPLGRTRIPILVRIADYAEARQRQVAAGHLPTPLIEFLGRHTWLGSVPVWSDDDPRPGQVIDPELLKRFFHDALKTGEVLLVLDGLDEVPASSLRDEIVEEVDGIAQRWVARRHTISAEHVGPGQAAFILSGVTADFPGNRLIVTSRVAGYHAAPLRGNLAHVTVEPMSQAAVARFIGNWMQAVYSELAGPKGDEQAVNAAAAEEAARFMADLRIPRQRGGRELATNPLLCGILATVFRQGKGELPHERVGLYKQAVDLLVNVWVRRQRDDEESRLLAHELFDVLEPIAEHIHRHEPTGLIPEPQLRQLALRFLAESRGENPLRPTPALRRAVEEMIQVVREDIGLLAARGEGVYGFLHLTFQEYLAARALVRDPVQAAARILERLGDARWREVIRLALGHVSVESPDQLTPKQA